MSTNEKTYKVAAMKRELKNVIWNGLKMYIEDR